MKKRKVGRPRKPGRPKKIKMKRKAAKRRGRPPGAKNKKQKVIRIVEPVVSAGSQINWEKQVLSILKTAVKSEKPSKEKAGLKEVIYTRTNVTSKNGSERMEFHIACAPGTDGKAELMILQGLRSGTAPVEPKEKEVSQSAKARMKEEQQEQEMHSNGFGN